MNISAFTKSALLVLFSICIAPAIYAQTGSKSKGLTPGNLTFTVKTITNNSTYSPRNVFAIWIKDSADNFVVSRKVMANSRKQHLVKWKANSNGNTVNAVTGATLQNHQTHTITWDGKNTAGVEVPDGVYQVWVEYSSTNSASNGNQGPSFSVNFNKGPYTEHLTPSNATYFKSIVLDWVPLGVGINDFEKSGALVDIFPNPVTSEMNLNLKIEKPSQAYICAYTLSGLKVATLINDTYDKGNQSFTWSGNADSGEQLANGVYLIQIQINGFTDTRKIIINH